MQQTDTLGAKVPPQQGEAEGGAQNQWDHEIWNDKERADQLDKRIKLFLIGHQEPGDLLISIFGIKALLVGQLHFITQLETALHQSAALSMSLQGAPERHHVTAMGLARGHTNHEQEREHELPVLDATWQEPLQLPVVAQGVPMSTVTSTCDMLKQHMMFDKKALDETGLRQRAQSAVWGQHCGSSSSCRDRPMGTKWVPDVCSWQLTTEWDA